jgi:hypothetical protein
VICSACSATTAAVAWTTGREAGESRLVEEDDVRGAADTGRVLQRQGRGEGRGVGSVESGFPGSGAATKDQRPVTGSIG